MITEIREIARQEAIDVINKFHYSKIIPRISKIYIGGYSEGELVAVCTLGYGVRPLHTIKKIFPTVDVPEYLEIGKLCVDDKMPRNSESTFIAMVIHHLQKNYKHIKLLYSWADGIIGKPGYVYQASNFFYGGYIWTEMYLDKSGVRVHPRSFQGFSNGKKKEGCQFNSRDYEVTTAMGFKKYFGLQFRYVYPLCNKNEWKKLLETSPMTWERCNYPKTVDCQWKEQLSKGKRISCDKPNFTMGKYVKQDYLNKNQDL